MCVSLQTMATRRAPTPSAQWSARVDVQAGEKIAAYNRKKSANEQLKMMDVSWRDISSW